MANEPTRFGGIAVDDPIPPSMLRDTDYDIVVPFYISGNQTAATKKGGWIAPFACTLVGYRLRVDTAPTGATLIVDVNKNGTTMFTTQGARPTVAISGNDGTTTLPDVVAVAAGDRITFDIDQIGSGTAGADLYLSLQMRAALV